jgi:hypothetical protein
MLTALRVDKLIGKNAYNPGYIRPLGVDNKNLNLE